MIPHGRVGEYEVSTELRVGGAHCALRLLNCEEDNVCVFAGRRRARGPGRARFRMCLA